MKTVLDKTTRTELIHRIQALTEDKAAQWGKMNVMQMVRHCTEWEEMIHKNIIYPRSFIGRLIGRMILRKEMKGSPMRKSSPTIPQLIINDTAINLNKEKEVWISYINSYEHYSLPDYSFVHPFFGKMTRAEIGYISFKHTDHHLRQFNC